MPKLTFANIVYCSMEQSSENSDGSNIAVYLNTKTTPEELHAFLQKHGVELSRQYQTGRPLDDIAPWMHQTPVVKEGVYRWEAMAG